MEAVLDTLREDLSETDAALSRDPSPHVRLCLETRRNQLIALIARLAAEPAPAPKPV